MNNNHTRHILGVTKIEEIRDALSVLLLIAEEVPKTQNEFQHLEMLVKALLYQCKGSIVLSDEAIEIGKDAEYTWQLEVEGHEVKVTLAKG